MSSAAPTVSEIHDGARRAPGARGPVPPFTAAHEALRGEIRSFVTERLPEENLLGALHGGFYLIMANFQWERLLMALGAVGAMQACFELTLDAVRAGGRHGQATRHALAHVATEIEAGRAVTYAALRRHLAGQDAVREVTIAKLRTQRAAVDAIDSCLQVLGLDAPPELERALRDARLGPIGGGTDEIMKEILGRSLGL
jgi:acyl-CoA dehydrogenase